MKKNIEFCPFCESKDIEKTTDGKCYCSDCDINFTNKDCSFDKDGKQMYLKDLKKYEVDIEITSYTSAVIEANNETEAKHKINTIVNERGYMPEDYISKNIADEFVKITNNVYLAE